MIKLSITNISHSIIYEIFLYNVYPKSELMSICSLMMLISDETCLDPSLEGGNKMTFKKCLCHSGLCGSVGWRIILYTERQLVRFWSRHMVVGLITILGQEVISVSPFLKQTNKQIKSLLYLNWNVFRILGY